MRKAGIMYVVFSEIVKSGRLEDTGYDICCDAVLGDLYMYSKAGFSVQQVDLMWDEMFPFILNKAGVCGGIPEEVKAKCWSDLCIECGLKFTAPYEKSLSYDGIQSDMVVCAHRAAMREESRLRRDYDDSFVAEIVGINGVAAIFGLYDLYKSVELRRKMHISGQPTFMAYSQDCDALRGW